MATLDAPSGGLRPLGPVINYEEPATKSAPALTTGLLAWIRDNLFSSFFNSILTVVLSVGLFFVIKLIVAWAIGQANWFVINKNIRLFLVGFYPQDQIWRLYLLSGIAAFLVGFGIASWARVSRLIAALIVGSVIFTFAAPRIIDSALDPAPSYVAVGNADIASGTISERPQEQVAFIAAEGEIISIQITAEASQNEIALAAINGFADRAANALMNSAGNRLEAQARIAEIEEALTGNRLTENQRAALTSELEGLEVGLSAIEAFGVNQSPVTVQILDGATLEILASQTLADATTVMEFEVPADAWYVLDKSIADESENTALLRVDGLSPLIERTINRQVAAGERSERILQYSRMADNFEIEQARPVIDDSNVPMAVIIDNQYRGDRPLGDYLSLFFGPFLELIQLALLVFVVIAAAGYFASQALNRQFPRPHPTNPRYAAQTWALRLWGLFPFIMVILLINTGTRLWGGLLLTFILTIFGIVISFPIGVLAALGRRSSLPVVKAVSVLYIELVRGVPLITILFMANLMVPLVHPSLADIPGVIRVTVGIILFTGAYLAENVRGGLQSIPLGQEEAAKAVGLNNFQITMYITLPQALRAVIPAMVGMFISLYKDTSLVLIVGLLDLTGEANAVIAQTEFIGLRTETYVFIAIIYFIFSYIMSIISRRIEASGAGAATQRL